jgi:hypothetical protein
MTRTNHIAVLLWICLSAAPAQDLASPQTGIAVTSGEQADPGNTVNRFARGLFTPTEAAKLALGLVYDQATVAVPEWGSGRDGLMRRTEWLAAGRLTRYTTEFATRSLLGTDTSYHRCRCKGFPRRAGHALYAEFVERKADGSAIFATARLTGIYASTAITAQMLPAGYGVADANSRAMAAIGIDEGFNLLQEFWPEIKRTLLLRRKNIQ